MDKHAREWSSADDPVAVKPEDKAAHAASRSADQKSAAVCYPVVAEKAEWSKVITLYDRQHFLTYAMLLSAERDKVDWRDGVREILLQDPEKDPRQASICWESHLERARWISTTGLQQAVARAQSQ
jgi:hypothetical protein